MRAKILAGEQWSLPKSIAYVARYFGVMPKLPEEQAKQFKESLEYLDPVTNE